ncbi:hypothetical protein JI735_34210 (plasmid) [Paenibacillus sonchi]|uniref:Uncharacterized protein n=1 Tax=Paenibacillus sonchi TaxID=373687 RepID=A0A974SGL3_9BACL|nr:hypothetical protein [Paenibacillus sonchi]QQZ64496.1 hypothetical protein JI735_34210 [Paenibacillus sonchi]
MSKLEGNERWKTKMIMTEHTDQFEAQQHARNNMITIDEMTMVRDLILLPYIDTMVGKSLKEIEHSGNILQRAYSLAGQAIQRRIMQDIYQLRKELKKRNIKVLEDEQDDFISNYIIFCRGYEGPFGMTRDVMRTEISLRLTKYTSELGNSLKDYFK